jgi:hypothetical protein
MALKVSGELAIVTPLLFISALSLSNNRGGHGDGGTLPAIITCHIPSNGQPITDPSCLLQGRTKTLNAMNTKEMLRTSFACDSAQLATPQERHRLS